MTVKRFSFEDLTTSTKTKEDNFVSGVTLGEHILAELALVPPQENDSSVEENSAIQDPEEVRDLFQEGFEAGYSQAREEFTEKEVKLLQEQNELLHLMLEQIRTYMEHNKKNLLHNNIDYIQDLTLAIAQKIGGSDTEFPHFIEGILEKYSAQLTVQEDIVLRLNPSFESLEEKICSYCQQKLPNNLQIKFDPKVREGEVQIEWKNGSLFYSKEEIYKQIDQIFLEMKN